MNIQAGMRNFVLQTDAGALSSPETDITAGRLDLVAFEFIQRMLAPPARQGLPGAWLLRDATLGLLVGCVLGLAAFGLVGSDSTTTSPPSAVIPPGESKSPAPAVKTPAVAPRNPAPEEVRLTRLLSAGLSRRVALPKSSPRSDTYRTLLRNGWRHFRQNRCHLAAVAFGRAVHLKPRQTDGYYGLALSLFEQGNEGAALRILESGAKKTGPKAALWVLAGSIYQWLGKEQAARKMYRRYLERHPDGAFAGDVRALLSRKRLPVLFDSPERLSVNPLR